MRGVTFVVEIKIDKSDQTQVRAGHQSTRIVSVASYLRKCSKLGRAVDSWMDEKTFCLSRKNMFLYSQLRMQIVRSESRCSLPFRIMADGDSSADFIDLMRGFRIVWERRVWLSLTFSTANLNALSTSFSPA